jgi:hypothetical protein
MGMQNTKKHFRWSRLTVSKGSRRQQGNQSFFEEKQRKKQENVVCRIVPCFCFCLSIINGLLHVT